MQWSPQRNGLLSASAIAFAAATAASTTGSTATDAAVGADDLHWEVPSLPVSLFVFFPPLSS